MPEQSYLFVVSGCCGLLGGYLACVLTAAEVKSQRRVAGQIADGFAWVYSTGGRGSATWGDVWRYRGGGPEQTAVIMPLFYFFISFATMCLVIWFPPPLLASCHPVPFWSWLNAGAPVAILVTCFGVAFGISKGLSSDYQNEIKWAAHAYGMPAALLTSFLTASYIWSISWQLIIVSYFIALAVAAAALVASGIKAFDSAVRATSWFAILVGGAAYAAMAFAFGTPHFSPLDILFPVSEAGAGIAGPNGEPPLKIKDLTAPISIVRAGYFSEDGSDYANSQTCYVVLKDSTGTEVELCVSPVKKDESSGKVAECQHHLYVGGTHPKQPSARLPLSRKEVETVISWLASARDAERVESSREIPVGPYPNDLFTLRNRELNKPVEDRLHEDSWRRQFVENMLGLAGHFRLQPLAGEADVIQRSLFCGSEDLQQLAANFRSRHSDDRVAQWIALEPRLTHALRHNVQDDLKQWLIDLLGPPSEAVPCLNLGAKWNYPWEYPPPSELDTLVFQLSHSKTSSGSDYRYAVIDLRTFQSSPIRRISAYVRGNTSAADSPAQSASGSAHQDSGGWNAGTSSLRERFAAFRKKDIRERRQEWDAISEKLSKYLAQHPPGECRSLIIGLLGESDSNPPDVLRDYVKVVLKPPGKVIFYRIADYGHAADYLVFAFNKTGRASSTLVHLKNEKVKSLTAEPATPN